MTLNFKDTHAFNGCSLKCITKFVKIRNVRHWSRSKFISFETFGYTCKLLLLLSFNVKFKGVPNFICIKNSLRQNVLLCGRTRKTTNIWFKQVGSKIGNAHSSYTSSFNYLSFILLGSKISFELQTYMRKSRFVFMICTRHLTLCER